MLLVRHPASHTAERRYILDHLLVSVLGLEADCRADDRADTLITLAESPAGCGLHLDDGLFAAADESWLQPGSLPVQPLRRWSLKGEPIAPRLSDESLPVLFGQPTSGGSYIAIEGESLRLTLDVLGGAFFQLTRYEELVERRRDAHERFPAQASLAYREGYLDRPLADEYAEVLWAVLHRLWPRLARAQRTFRVRPSHDVDWPLHRVTSAPRLAKAVAGDLVRRRDAGLARARLQAAHARRRGDPGGDPYNAFDFIMELSESRGLSSAFYFQAGHTNDAFDGAYRLTDDWIGALLRRIHGRGHEIGLHPSYETFRDHEALRGERDALIGHCARLGIDQAQWGGRQHFLRWENPTTWRAWADAGLDYDASLGYSTELGFRCGSSLEFGVFDLVARRALPLRERPLLVMDMALLAGRSRLTGEREDALSRLVRRCRLFGGELSLLWHNSRMASPSERRAYAWVLARCAS